MYVRRNASGESGTTRGTSGLRKSTFVLWQVHTELFRIDTDWIECKLDNLYFLLRIFSDNIQIGIFWSDDVLILELQNQLTLCQNEIVQKFRIILIVTLSSTLFKRILAIHFKSSSLLFISTLIDYLIRFRSIFDNYNNLYRHTKLFRNSEQFCSNNALIVELFSPSFFNVLAAHFKYILNRGLRPFYQRTWLDFDLYSITTTLCIVQQRLLATSLQTNTSRANFRRLDFYRGNSNWPGAWAKRAYPQSTSPRAGHRSVLVRSTLPNDRKRCRGSTRLGTRGAKTWHTL